jgi:hypothetical protein
MNGLAATSRLSPCGTIGPLRQLTMTLAFAFTDALEFMARSKIEEELE